MNKKVVFTEEEPVDLSGLEPKEVDEEDIDEKEIEKMFTFEPMQVDEVIKQETRVDVIPLRESKTSFGGQWYYFTKGKKQKVPTALRDRLLQNKQNPKIRDVW